MKLNQRNVFPINNGFVIALNCSTGLLGVLYFCDGEWFVMPSKHKLSDTTDFMWIELTNEKKGQKRRDKREGK